MLFLIKKIVKTHYFLQIYYLNIIYNNFLDYSFKKKKKELILTEPSTSSYNGKHGKNTCLINLIVEKSTSKAMLIIARNSMHDGVHE